MCVCCMCAGVVCTVVKIMPYQFWQFLWLQYVLYVQSDYFIQMSVLLFVSGFYFKNFLSCVRCYITLTGNCLLVDMAWLLRRPNDTPLTASNLESPKCLILYHCTLWSIFPLEKLVVAQSIHFWHLWTPKVYKLPLKLTAVRQYLVTVYNLANSLKKKMHWMWTGIYCVSVCVCVKRQVGKHLDIACRGSV